MEQPICDFSLSSDEDLNIYATDTFGSKDSDTDNTDHLCIDTDFCASHSSNSFGGFYSADFSDSDNFDEEEIDYNPYAPTNRSIMKIAYDSRNQSEPFPARKKVQCVKLSSGLKSRSTNKILTDLIAKKKDKERRITGIDNILVETLQDKVSSAEETPVSSPKNIYVSIGISPRARHEDTCKDKEVVEGRKRLKVSSSGVLFSPPKDCFNGGEYFHKCLLQPSAFKDPSLSQAQESGPIHPKTNEWGAFNYHLSVFKIFGRRRFYVPIDGRQLGRSKTRDFKFKDTR